jgi:16S rRNA (uracil1498-N3)-methyltransferase
MHRFFLPPEQCNESLVLDDREAHHALHVLRLKPGDPVTILNGVGGVYSCRISATTKSSVRLEALQQRTIAPLPWRITLFQAIPKGKVFEEIVEKATELGAFRIVPVISQRVVSTPENPERKLERWKTAAIEAIKQCGSPWLPQIEAPLKLAEAMKRHPGSDLSLVASLEGERRHPRRWLEALRPSGSDVDLAVWIGPEGDLSPQETSLLIKAGARPITLGNLVLRADTAAIYCLSILSYEMEGRFGPGVGPSPGAAE